MFKIMAHVSGVGLNLKENRLHCGAFLLRLMPRVSGGNKTVVCRFYQPVGHDLSGFLKKSARTTSGRQERNEGQKIGTGVPALRTSYR